MPDNTGSGLLNITRTRGVLQVHFADRNILDEASIDHIGEQLKGLIQTEEEPKILLNFSNVEHLSSSALGMLITLNKSVRQQGGVMKLSNINSQIHEVFSITRLDRMFEIFDDAERALATFQK